MRSLLAFMDAEDRAHVLRFYEKLFDQAGEEGEGALLKKLGSPVRQVLQVERLYRDKQKAEELVGAADAVEEAIVAAEEPAVVPAQVAEEEEPAQPESVEAAAFAVPSEEDAVDFSAEEPVTEDQPEEETQPEESAEEPAEIPTEADDNIPEEEAFEEEAETEAESVDEEEEEPEDEGVTEIVPAPDAEEGDDASEEEPEEDPDEDEEDHDEDEDEDEPDVEEPQKEPVGAGRVVAAVFVTIPMILFVLLGFAVSLVLGFASMGVGVVFGAAGGYLSGYAFGGMTAFLPDILLLAGGMLLCFCLALFFLWLGIWLAVGGVRLTIRGVRAVYRSILKRGGQDHE